MKHAVCTLLVLFAGQVTCSIARAADVPVCKTGELLGYVPDQEQVQHHRQFTLPTISYPFGTKLNSYDGGFLLTLRINAFGEVACYGLKNRIDQNQPLNDQHREVIHQLHNWHYAPFSRDGAAVEAIVAETLAEQETPKTRKQMPDVPLAQVHVGLSRSGCYGWCPSYSVDVYGDGRAVYVGNDFVDVVGKHQYQVAPEVVAKLVNSLLAKDLWSLRESYRAPITDNSTYKITMQLGDQTHSIEDYVGQSVGMPPTVTDFEKEIDEAADSESWIHLGHSAVVHLKQEGFVFASPEGGALLKRAVANEYSHDDKAMLEVIQLGAPLDVVTKDDEDYPREKLSLFERALQRQRAPLLDALVEKGALRTNGAPDKQKIDGAFRAAIEGANLSLAQKVWNAAGADSRPALTFPDRGYEQGFPLQQSSVTLLLAHHAYEPKNWQALEITRWLEGLGCDVRAHGADGTTLLHIAAEAGDARFVRYLLDRGINPSTPGHFGLPALGSVHNEDVAMMLLEAGTNMSSMHDKGDTFRKFAEYNHWARVIAWLDQHTDKQKGKL
jgi:hypothetical protein